MGMLRQVGLRQIAAVALLVIVAGPVDAQFNLPSLPSLGGLGGSGSATALPSGTIGPDSLFYYELGGGRATSRALNNGAITKNYELSGEASIGFSCGKFNPIASITNQFANMAEGIQTQVIGAASGAIAALPMMVLQKANPGLYDQFQNALLRFEKVLSISTKSCEQMQQEGLDGFQDWITIAKGSDWETVIGTGEEDVVTAKKTVEANGGTKGITRPGGVKKGGLDMEQIKPIEETATAGYNATYGKAPDSTTAGTTGTPLADLWSTPQEAGEWTASVFGDELISTCGVDDGCEASKGVPGIGLATDMEREEKTVRDDLNALIVPGATITESALKDVSAPGIDVTEKLVLAMRELGANDSTRQRLASEVALARAVNKALFARRILLRGRSMPENYDAPPALDSVDRTVAQIEREVQMLMYESRIRKELMSTTAAMSLMKVERERSSGFKYGRTRAKNLTPMENSVVEP